MAKKSNEWRPLIVWAVVTILTAAVSGLLGVQFAPVPPPLIVEKEKLPAEYAETFGWVYDPDAVDVNLDPRKTLQFSQTPAGRAALADDKDVYLWQAVRKAANLPADQYPNVNQGPVGSCVGAGNKHGVDTLQAVQVAAGAPLTWKPVSLEVIYAGSRVEIGQGRIRGDGSVGAWAAKWLKDYGVVPMEVVGKYDLTQYSPSRARSWGRSGVPDDLEATAREHPVKGTALVKTWADVDRAIRQGYPVTVCSDRGFTMERDRDGFARPSGTWAHCMCIIGVRGGRRPGGFILNSWGDNAHTGPRFPDDAPPAGFWADADVIGRMVSQGDSFALSDVQGFPGRKLPDDWFIRAQPRKPIDLLALSPDWRLAP